MKETYCRIDGVIARKANKAVILRRGPTKHIQMLIWDFKTDHVQAGQWVKNQSITLFGVSDDAEYVSTIGADYRPVEKVKRNHQIQNWLAISHPPFFTAVGLWELDNYNCNIEAANSNNLVNKPLPERALSLAARTWDYESRALLEADGWEITFEDEKSERHYFSGYKYKVNSLVKQTKALSRGYIQINILGRNHATLRENVTTLLVAQKNDGVIETVREWPQRIWIDLDNAGRLVYADKGCLWAWENFPEGEPKLIADLNGNTFEEVAPPDWALKP